MTNAYLHYFLAEVKTHWRQSFSWVTGLLFFIMVVSFFPIALGANESLKMIGPGIIWVTALLAIIISCGTLFKQDEEEGFLEILIMNEYSLAYLLLIKILSHWLTHCLPLIIVSPILGVALQLSPESIGVLVVTLCLGTPILSLFGGIGASLLVGLRGYGLLLPVLIMPFYLPVLIFGTGTVIMAQSGTSLLAYYAILGAYLLLTLTFAPFITSLAIRNGMNQ